MILKTFFIVTTLTFGLNSWKPKLKVLGSDCLVLRRFYGFWVRSCNSSLCLCIDVVNEAKDSFTLIIFLLTNAPQTGHCILMVWSHWALEIAIEKIFKIWTFSVEEHRNNALARSLLNLKENGPTFPQFSKKHDHCFQCVLYWHSSRVLHLFTSNIHSEAFLSFWMNLKAKNNFEMSYLFAGIYSRFTRRMRAQVWTARKQ